jgi:two-component system phosphate regulon sensor histidine kinase PhoR
MNNLCYGLCLLDNKTRSWDENETIVIKKVSEYIGKIIIGATLYSKNLFISNVMHELKNPLAAINTFAEAIINRDKEKSELTGNFIVKIKNNVDRLNSIMDNMLFVSSLGAGVEKFGAIKLMEVLNDSIEQINDLASKKNIKILLDTKVELKIYAKKELLSQAFINVLNNAIKYSPCDSNIHINVIKEATEACVSIKDEGCGIDEENQKYIFEPFYRVDKLRSKSTGGTGLGLYITKCIIQKFNGRINCESGLGEGTAFNLHFPLENNL